MVYSRIVHAYPHPFHQKADYCPEAYKDSCLGYGDSAQADRSSMKGEAKSLCRLICLKRGTKEGLIHDDKAVSILCRGGHTMFRPGVRPELNYTILYP